MLNSSIEDDEPLPRHLQARPAFPMSPLLIVAVGLLSFLLVLSAGFNVWFFLSPDVRGNRDIEARRAADVARQQAIQAEEAAQRALVVQQEFQRKQAVLQREIEDLTRQLEAAKEQLDDTKRGKTEK